MTESEAKAPDHIWRVSTNSNVKYRILSRPTMPQALIMPPQPTLHRRHCLLRLLSVMSSAPCQIIYYFCLYKNTNKRTLLANEKLA